MENKVLATINGREITQNDLNVNISRFPREKQSQFYNEEGRKQLLEQMISFELIYNEALENGVEEDEQYLAQLELAKKELLTQTAINNLLSEVKVSEDEVKDYYEVNKDMFVASETVTAKHILVDSKEKAVDIKAEIEGGKSFEEAAQEYSSCPSKAEGGNLGSFSKGQMVPEFEEAAFNLEIGVVSEAVETQFGFHLIKVEDKEEGNAKSFDEVKDRISNNILQERQNFKFMSTTDDLKKRYKVEMFI
ncbi:MAG: peptidylprolyl isomerase [Clostridiaceae bacterium]|nr:peptidylprolyl isomerase [Clostridiaceae bacterium]